MNPKLERRLDALEQALSTVSEDAMLVGELDGFLTAVLVCPELIQPFEWLPLVWSTAPGGEEPACTKTELDVALVGVMTHYNGIAAVLLRRPEKYDPIFEVDERNGDLLWEIWIEGFVRAMELRPQAWDKIFEDKGSEGAAVFNMLAALVAIVERKPEEANLSPEQVEQLSAEAPALIPIIVRTFDAWRKAHMPAMHTSPTPRPCRNDPCPCGSGKKFKKCCGAG